MFFSACSGFIGGMCIEYFRQRSHGLHVVFVASAVMFLLTGLFYWGAVRSGQGAGSVAVVSLIYSLFCGSLVVAGVWWGRKRDLQKGGSS